MMGSKKSHKYAFTNEFPRHQETVDSFWIGKYEVTQEQYKRIMGNNPSHFKGSKRPVENVNWYKAMKFCEKFSDKHGVKARLPYESEWEYACRAGTSTEYYWGRSIDNRYCWYNKNSDDRTHPVGQKKPNNWGLYDMSGNVFEWCRNNNYRYGYYPDSEIIKGMRTVRGGSCYSTLGNICSASRFLSKPDTATGANGFRVIITSL